MHSDARARGAFRIERLNPGQRDEAALNFESIQIKTILNPQHSLIESPLTKHTARVCEHPARLKCLVVLGSNLMHEASGAIRAIQENATSTLPNGCNSITTLSPALSQIVLTRLPVSTISPARRPLPLAARWLASQASAL